MGGMRQRPVLHLPLLALQLMRRLFTTRLSAFALWFLYDRFEYFEQCFQKFLYEWHLRYVGYWNDRYFLKCRSVSGSAISLARRLGADMHWWESDYDLDDL